MQLYCEAMSCQEIRPEDGEAHSGPQEPPAEGVPGEEQLHRLVAPAGDGFAIRAGQARPRRRKGGPVRQQGVGGPRIHQETPGGPLVHQVGQHARGGGVEPPRALQFPDCQAHGGSHLVACLP